MAYFGIAMEPLWIQRLYAYAWQAHLEKYNFFVSEEEIRQFVGVDDRIVHSFYAEQVNLENFETTMQELGKIIGDFPK